MQITYSLCLFVHLIGLLGELNELKYIECIYNDCPLTDGSQRDMLKSPKSLCDLRAHILPSGRVGTANNIRK